MALADILAKAIAISVDVDTLLFSVAPINCMRFVFDPCFVMQYLVSVLVSQSSLWGKRELVFCFVV